MRLLSAAILVLTLASCDTGAYDTAGDADVSVTGALTSSSQGKARFGDGAGLSISTDAPVFVSLEPVSDRLAPGRYAIGVRRGPAETSGVPSDTLGAGLTVYGRDAPTLSFGARSGELVVESASEREMRGTLTFRATRLAVTADSAQTIDVRIRFRAEYVPFCC